MIERVPEGWAYVVERMGRRHRVLQSGLHCLLPLLDAVRYRVDCRERVLVSEEIICPSRDGVPLGVEVVMVVSVFDPILACYEVTDWSDALKQLSKARLKAEVQRWSWREAMDRRDRIREKVRGEIDDHARNWGVKVKNFDTTELSLPHYLLEQ